MRRLTLALLVLALPIFGNEGQTAVLTESGTYYSVSIVTLDEKSVPPNTAIELATQTGEERSTGIIPGTDLYGLNFEPSLFWDERSQTLILFWVRMPSMMSSEILFTSFNGEEWSEPTSIDNGIFRFRKNLKTAATHSYTVFDDEGNPSERPGLAIHAVWWDENSTGSDAMYAILGFEDGAVTSISRFTLADLIDRSEIEPTVLHPDFDRTFFQIPAITVRPGLDAIEVVFGDWDYNVLHKIDLEPIFANGVLTIPNGFRGAEPIVPEYEFANASLATEPVQLVTGAPGSDQLAVYWKAERVIYFTRYRDDSWSRTSPVVLNDQVSEEKAVISLRRLVGRY